ncbi:MAG TPA: hypothetical protein VL337_18065 [Acidimicrobiales bacterium]|nr:hypothetical protein [Acidimicrobiales bacterium]
MQHRDERGAIIVLAAVGLVMAMIMAGMAVDIGMIAQRARTDQKVADLVALDAVRSLPSNPTAAAQASATRNNFAYGSTGYTLLVEWGPSTTGPWSTATSNLASAAAVRVTAMSPNKTAFPFLSGPSTVTRKAVATKAALGGFLIGSSLATFDTSRSAILDRFMGGILKGSAISTGLVSWSGLAGANVTMDALRTQLATMGFSVGSVSQLMSADMTVAQLMQATAAALTAQGVVGAGQAAILNTLKAQVTSSALTQIHLGQFMTVAQGADNTALASQLNVFQLVTAAAQVANGSHFIDVSDVGISGLPANITSVKASLQVIEAPKYYFGPVGGSVSTSQISLTVTPKLNLSLPVTVGLNIATIGVTSDYPVKVTAGGAVGTLTAASCGTSPGISVQVDPSAFSGSISANLTAGVTLLGLPVATVNIPETSVVPSTDGGAGTLSFSYPSQFPPPLGTSTTQHWGSQPIGLSSLTQITAGTATVTVGTLPVGLPLATVVSTVLGALPGVLGNVDNLVLTPLLKALGTDLGSADVTAEALQCDLPVLSA